MSTITKTPTEAPPALDGSMLFVMSLACGISAANIIYNQPLLGDFARDFHTDAGTAGQVSTASQVGYGLGLLFLLPLGDLVNRRKLVLLLTLGCAALMAGTAFAPSMGTLILLHLFIGVTAMSAQILIPLAVEMSPSEKRGHTVGMLMAGLLGGILLARTLSGFFSDHFGWRAMFGLAAGMMVVLAALLAAKLPHRAPTASMSYPELMKSLFGLVKTKRRIRPSTLVSALSFGSFSVFWTSLSFLMEDRFHRGASEAGLFGVVGLVGALGAPLAGKISDRLGSRFLIGASLVLCIAAFLLMGARVTIPMIVIGVLLLDLGVQAVQVAEQSKVIALVPEARSRVNALYMVGRFIGGAFGCFAGAYAWTHGGWTAVCAVGAGMSLLALLIHLAGKNYGVETQAEKFTHGEEFAENPVG